MSYIEALRSQQETNLMIGTLRRLLVESQDTIPEFGHKYIWESDGPD